MRNLLTPYTRRQLGDPDLLHGPAIMQHLDLTDGTLRLHAIHMRRDNAELLHAAGAVPGELMQQLVACPGRGGRDGLCRGFQIVEWLAVCGRVDGGREGREVEEGIVRLVTGLEEGELGIEDRVAETAGYPGFRSA